ncbi:MAG: putative bifunctional diguanylate cyclase/phosphodiesterase, partial [Thiohalomonadales bacterium]
GLTIFSTDPSQIGVDKHDDPNVIRANAGEIRSELNFRNQFYGSDKIIIDRNLLSTYVPIKPRNNGPTLAVFELYTDVTDSVLEMNNTHKTITVGVTIALSLLYLFLLAIVRRADRIIKCQEKERINQEKTLHYHAFYDSLTGLFNRTSFTEHLKMQLNRANDQHTAFALLHIDVDRFKLINDSLGNDAGDSFLRIAADKLKQNFRGGETAFRMGGDEFLIIIEGIKHAQDCGGISQNIIRSFQTPVKLNGQEIIVTVSIGISIYPNDSKNGDRLVKEANMAMIQAKELGRNNYNFYSGDMDTEALEHLEMVSALQKAHKNQEFELHYQPKICSKTKQIVAVEALLRWQHPIHGMVPPIKFIPILEETGLITPVSEWIFHTACEQNKHWQEQNLPPIQMAVNVSAQHFKNNLLVTHIKQVLLNTDLDPQYLDLELTESMFIDNIESAIRTMHSLKELGIFLSVDDFGSGFSSLSYLKRFPIDCLKIDRIFIDDISNGGKDATITS